MKVLAIIAGVLLAAVVVVALILKSVADSLNENLNGPPSSECKNCVWPIYRNYRYGFVISYPQGSSVHKGADSSHAVGNYFDGTRTPIVTIVPKGDFPERAFLTVSVATEIKTEERCRLMVPAGADTPVRMRRTTYVVHDARNRKWFNGNAFVRPASGTHLQSFVFHTLYAGICYEVTLNGLAGPHEDSSTLRDTNSAWAPFDDVFNSIAFFPRRFRE